ncbi:MAG: VOC family protein [Anaerolineae bacterium]|jgi:catechol 2,3-dioxygenase-like lactoylglutathione lyase family enzyme|nr:VOC family protein [Anaerolineae bacterium]
MPNITRLHHVQITVPSDRVDEARAFYLDLLGLTEIPKPDSLKARGGFWVLLAGQEIHISLEDGVNRAQTKAHIAYEVDDLDGWRALLAGKGIQTDGNAPIPGYDRFEFRDPFGNRVEFIAPLPENDH